MIKAIVAKTDGTIYHTEIDNYKDYYKHLECDCFDVIYSEVNGIKVNIFADDEGLLKPNNLGWDIDGIPLFGNLVFTGDADEDGETTSIDESITTLDISCFIHMPVYITKG